MNKEYISRKELSFRWNISSATLGNWEKVKYGPKAYERGPRKKLYKVSEIEAFEKENPALIGASSV